MSRAGRLPYVSLLLAGAAAAACLVPGLPEALQYTRSGMANGEVWRALTCHLTHVSGEHLLWDVLPLLALGAILEAGRRSRLLLVVGASAVLIPLGLWYLMPGLETYRGLSGISTALYVLLATEILRGQMAARRPVPAICAGLALLLLAAKIIFEMTTGRSYLIDGARDGLVPVPLAHALGAGVGLALGGGAIHYRLGRRAAAATLAAVLLATSGCLSVLVTNAARGQADIRDEILEVPRLRFSPPHRGSYVGTSKIDGVLQHRFLFPGVLTGGSARLLVALVPAGESERVLPVSVRDTWEPFREASPALLRLGSPNHLMGKATQHGELSEPDLGILFPTLSPLEERSAHILFLNITRDPVEGSYRGPTSGPDWGWISMASSEDTLPLHERPIMRSTTLPATLALLLLAMSGCSFYVHDMTQDQARPYREFPGRKTDDVVPPVEGAYVGITVDRGARYHRFLFPGILAGGPPRQLEILVAEDPGGEGPTLRVGESSTSASPQAPAILLLGLSEMPDMLLSLSSIVEVDQSAGPALSLDYPSFRVTDHTDAHLLHVRIGSEGAEGHYRGPQGPGKPVGWRHMKGEQSLDWVARNHLVNALTHGLYLVTVPSDIALSPLWLLAMTVFWPDC